MEVEFMGYDHLLADFGRKWETKLFRLPKIVSFSSREIYERLQCTYNAPIIRT